MPTLRESIEARIKELEGEAAAERAKLENLHPTLAAVLEHPVEEVVAFFRSVGAHLFPHQQVKVVPPAPAAAPTETTGQTAA